MKHILQLFITFFPAVVFLCSCKENKQTLNSGLMPTSMKLSFQAPKDTLASNKLRNEIGLRTIKADWAFYRTSFMADDWNDTTKHGGKRVQRDKTGRVIWEEDYYYSGITYKDEFGTDWEHITTHYDYANASWLAFYTGTNSAIKAQFMKFQDGTPTPNEITNAVDKTLKKWGISR